MAFLLALKAFGFVFSVELGREVQDEPAAEDEHDEDKPAEVMPVRKMRLGFAAPEEHEESDEDEDDE